MTLSGHEEQKAKVPLLISPNVNSAESNEAFVSQTSGCVLDLGPKSRVQASHFEIKQARVHVSFKSHLGKTKAFAMFINVSVKHSRERSLLAKNNHVLGKVELWQWLEAVQLHHCLVKKIDGVQRLIWHLSIRWSGALSLNNFFLGHCFFFFCVPA